MITHILTKSVDYNPTSFTVRNNIGDEPVPIDLEQYIYKFALRLSKKDDLRNVNSTTRRKVDDVKTFNSVKKLAKTGGKRLERMAMSVNAFAREVNSISADLVCFIQSFLMIKRLTVIVKFVEDAGFA